MSADAITLITVSPAPAGSLTTLTKAGRVTERSFSSIRSMPSLPIVTMTYWVFNFFLRMLAASSTCATSEISIDVASDNSLILGLNRVTPSYTKKLSNFGSTSTFNSNFFAIFKISLIKDAVSNPLL